MTDRIPDMQREPSQSEVYQSESDVPGMIEVPVRVEGPVRAQALPAESWAVAFYELSTTEATRVARRDPRRKRAVITVATQLAWIGPTQSGCRPNVGYRMGAAATSTIEITHTEEIWAMADTAGSLLSILVEYWTI
jgi:hypothetical protein